MSLFILVHNYDTNFFFIRIEYRNEYTHIICKSLLILQIKEFTELNMR